MILSSHESAILALFITSIVVRILPVFMPLRLGSSARRIVEKQLPIAVFISFAVYIVCTEMTMAPVAALAAMVAAAAMTFATRRGLIVTTAVSTAVYVAMQLARHA